MSRTTLPSAEEFAGYAREARFVPVYRQLTSDTLTPVTAYQKISGGEWAFLFESVVGGERIGRYSFVGCQPFMSLTATGRNVTIEEGGQVVRTFESSDPLKDLDQLVQQFRSVSIPGLPRFSGGAVGYAAYDVIRYTENLPNVPADDRGVPDMCFALFDSMIVFDHIRKVTLVICLADTQGQSLSEARSKAETRIDELCQRLAQTSGSRSGTGQTSKPGPEEVRLTDIDLTVEPKFEVASNFTESEFISAVDRCREYIKAGDIFQVVISQRFRHRSSATPLDVYRSLRMVNPSPFMFLLRTPSVNLVGSSPEIMVRVEDGETTIRPLAGTRRRGATPQEDRALAEELLADPKERAEHVMLIDLARNDVGRVAQFGSVQLSDVMVVERYSHVMHITSNVSGMLKPGLSAVEALRAGLPAGTVSGAPKVRAMEVIDEVEPQKRGPYGGAVGYIDFTGNMDTCIALRTLVMKDGIIDIQAGAGIVADSVPAMEYQETLNKARAMLKAIHIAETQLHSS